jgi:hypothetical protein
MQRATVKKRDMRRGRGRWIGPGIRIVPMSRRKERAWWAKLKENEDYEQLHVPFLIFLHRTLYIGMCDRCGAEYRHWWCRPELWRQLTKRRWRQILCLDCFAVLRKTRRAVRLTMRDVKKRLEYLRGELRAERISCDELHELQSLIPHIEPGDVELLEAAGVPEFPESKPEGAKP